MRELLVDTSAYSEFLRGGEEVGEAIRSADLLCLSPVIVGELLAGFRKGDRQRKNESELKRFLASPRVDIVDIDFETAERYSLIWLALQKAGTPIPTNDLWIAATAMQHGLRLITLDRHFLKVPQVIVEFFGT